MASINKGCKGMTSEGSRATGRKTKVVNTFMPTPSTHGTKRTPKNSKK